MKTLVNNLIEWIHPLPLYYVKCVHFLENTPSNSQLVLFLGTVDIEKTIAINIHLTSCGPSPDQLIVHPSHPFQPSQVGWHWQVRVTLISIKIMTALSEYQSKCTATLRVWQAQWYVSKYRSSSAPAKSVPRPIITTNYHQSAVCDVTTEASPQEPSTQCKHRTVMYFETLKLQVRAKESSNFAIKLKYIPICASSMCWISSPSVVNVSPQPLNLQLFNRNTAICIGLRSDGEGPACLRRLASDADAEQLMMPEARVAPDFPATIANTSCSIHVRQTLTFLLKLRF